MGKKQFKTNKNKGIKLLSRISGTILLIVCIHLLDGWQFIAKLLTSSFDLCRNLFDQFPIATIILACILSVTIFLIVRLNTKIIDWIDNALIVINLTVGMCMFAWVVIANTDIGTDLKEKISKKINGLDPVYDTESYQIITEHKKGITYSETPIKENNIEPVQDIEINYEPVSDDKMEVYEKIKQNVLSGVDTLPIRKKISTLQKWQ